MRERNVRWIFGVALVIGAITILLAYVVLTAADASIHIFDWG